MGDVECVVAGEGDVGRVLDWMRAFYVEERLTWGDACEAALRALVARAELGKVAVIRENGVGVGYFLLTFGYSIERGGKTALLDELFVVPEARGRGIGRSAVGAAADMARAARCRALFVEVDLANARAQELYRKSGFKSLGRDYLALQMD